MFGSWPQRKNDCWPLGFGHWMGSEVVTLVDELAAKEVLAQMHHELTGPDWLSGGNFGKEATCVVAHPPDNSSDERRKGSQ